MLILTFVVFSNWDPDVSGFNLRIFGNEKLVVIQTPKKNYLGSEYFDESFNFLNLVSSPDSGD